MGKPIDWRDDWIVANYSHYPTVRESVDAYNKEFNTNVAYPAFSRHIHKKLNLQINYYFTEEQMQWLKDNYGCTYKELTDRFNEKFGTNYIWSREEYSPIERLCKRMGLSRYNTNYGYTAEEDEWLKEYAPRFSNAWLSENIESVSGRKHSEDSIKIHIREWLDIRKGNGGIREDTIQTYKKPIGSICSWGNTQVRIKIQDTGDDKKDWYPYGRYVYEQYYGIKLPKDVQVIHLDGDNINFDISNLEPVTRSEHITLGKNGWHCKGEITRTGIKYAKLKNILKQANCNS